MNGLGKIITGDTDSDPELLVHHDDNRRLIRKRIDDYDQLSIIVEGHKAAGRTIGLTIGSWDILHIGHLRYLIEAKKRCNILIVGVDSNRAIKLYKKSDFRPYVPEDYRSEELCYLDMPDYVTLVDDVDENGVWQYELLRVTKPDIFIAVEDSYPEEQRQDIIEHAKILRVIPRQAEDLSTTKFIKETVKGHLIDLANNITM